MDHISRGRGAGSWERSNKRRGVWKQEYLRDLLNKSGMIADIRRPDHTGVLWSLPYLIVFNTEPGASTPPGVRKQKAR